MSNSWFPKMPPVMPISIAPKPQERPPLWLPLIAMAVAVAPLVGFVLWAWM